MNSASYLFFSPDLKKGSNIECGICHVAYNLKVEIWPGKSAIDRR